MHADRDAAVPASPDVVPRPALLSSTAVVLVVFTLLVFVTDRAVGLGFFVVYGAIAAVIFVVVWYFWRGQNWARWLGRLAGRRSRGRRR